MSENVIAYVEGGHARETLQRVDWSDLDESVRQAIRYGQVLEDQVGISAADSGNFVLYSLHQ
jgi:peptidase E